MVLIGTLSLLLIFALGGAPSLAQTEPATTEPSTDGLRAEMTVVRRMYSPHRPIWVRVTLRNTSDQAIELPRQSALDTGSAIGLPLEIVFGSAGEPAFTVARLNEKPVPVPPPAPAESASPQSASLRLAAHACVGTEVDLREYSSALRYTGNYHVEWRPLSGRAGTAAIDFEVEDRRNATIVTDKGKITFALMYDEAPRNVENFLELVKSDFYAGKTIHKIVPGFLMQGGCPKGDGTGIRPDGKLLPAEFHHAPFELGTLAMARKPSDPNSASCQFFITLARVRELDGQYTVIGQATDEESLRTLNQFANEPTDRTRYRPRVPLVIRSINLVEAEQSGTTRLELKTRRAAPLPTSASPAAKSDQP